MTRLALVSALLLAFAPDARGATLFTRTAHVEALAVGGGAVWAATRGGVEVYDLATLARRRLYTTADGLDSNHARGVTVRGGEVVVRTQRASCRLAGERFSCAPAPPQPFAVPGAPRPVLFQGARVTATEALADGRRLLATAGHGLWLAGAAPRRLTPPNQICSNHVVAVARSMARTWLGSFDEGLCSFDGKVFRDAAGPFTMINDLVATPHALYVAASSGLFRTTDGERFARVHDLDGQGAVDLSFDGKALWVVTSLALWRLPDTRAPIRHWQGRRFSRPGGSRALQAVDANGGAVWLAAEDVGALRLTGRGRFEIFDRARGLPSSWAVDVAVAPDGGAYVATLRDGLVRVMPDGRAGPAGVELPDRWLLHVGLDRGSGQLWIGTQAGAAKVAPDLSLQVLRGDVDLPDPCVHVVAALPEGIWLGTEGGTLLLPR
jgi:ligand-binding sensor domain-containing protein